MRTTPVEIRQPPRHPCGCAVSLQSGGQDTDLDVNDYCFTSPLIVEIRENQPILKRLKKYEETIAGKDILLIRTGFQSTRQS
jgi:hypothetical protein